MEMMEHVEASPVDFCTLGMFIIDEIHFPPPKPPRENVMGGAGSYAALGARLFCPPPRSKSVGWIVDAGSDFPEEIRESIRQWDTRCLLRESSERLTTRAWNGYGDGEKRAFRYLTPKLRLGHQDLTRDLLLSRSFHLICSPTRCVDLVTGILTLRKPFGPPAPLFIWEPVPDLCLPGELVNCYEALKHVDVASPNHMELGAFFGHESADPQSEDVDRHLVEAHCRTWLDQGVGQNSDGAVVVRAGKAGCYLATRAFSRWLPAYYDPNVSEKTQSQSRVVDPTGGGNAFLGGLAIGLLRGEGESRLQYLEDAAIWASVAASFAIEQVGMPSLAQDRDKERWNGVVVNERLKELRTRLST